MSFRLHSIHLTNYHTIKVCRGYIGQEVKFENNKYIPSQLQRNASKKKERNTSNDKQQSKPHQKFPTRYILIQRRCHVYFV